MDAVLLVVCLFLYLGKDRTPPVISFGDSMTVYEDGMDESLLLQEVTAMDDKDGDVSNSLMVEKIAGTNGKEVIVTFVALDQSNNVGKASKVFAVASGSATAPDGEDMQADDGNGNEEKSGSAPVLVMNSDEIITKKGNAPNWNTVIETMSDDKDDYNTLYNNLKLEGHVDLSRPGEYPETLYTVQSWRKMKKHQHMRGLEKPLSRPGYTLIIQEAWKGLHSMKISDAVRIPLI